MAPTEAPKTRSARMPRRISSWSMPTWTAPRLPPPASTKAVRVRCPRAAPVGRVAPLRPAGAQALGPGAGAGHRRSGRRVGHGAARGVGGDCWLRDCWRSRHALRPARSWRTAHRITMTTSTTIATTKIPKIDEEGGVAGRRQREEGGCHDRLRVEDVTPRGHTAPMVLVAPRPLLRPAHLRVTRRRTWHGRRGAGTPPGGRRGPPPLRPRAGRRSAGMARGRRLRRGGHAGRARPAALPRAAPAARLARRMA